ncbi:large ribosomal subunit protein uL2m [Cylas formicarius]|uniref:large ribosomal subunit protein uL2m n=1 Tax=Cylas formicarius TaxID=197179 RepID=UPI002958382A|nr:large ribosomal subunit protein uL2m [Cylas formicarius]
MSSLIKALTRLSILEVVSLQKTNVRSKTKFVEKPVTGHGIAFRRKVHFPEKYTVEPLKVTNLAGRDPNTGRVVCNGIGGGIKHKYHWIDWKRVGPKEGPPQEEKVIKIIKDGCRTAFIALVAYQDKLKYILATENMKAGDIIKTSCHIPRIPVKANEGDAYPLGALPTGTKINCVEKYPGLGGFLVHAAGGYATIVRKESNNHVVISVPSKREFSLPETCMCTVGRLSNVEHDSTPIGSAQKNRELGNRPRSGWWQRKTGKHGRKLRRPPPVKTIGPKKISTTEVVSLTYNGPFVKTMPSQFHY